MKRSHWISVLTVPVVTFFLGGLALAERCPDLTGVWDVSSESSFYESTGVSSLSCASVSGVGGCFGYSTSTGVLHIEGQNGCLFYGFYERTDKVEPVQPLTGAIGSAFEIRVTGSATLAEGNLVGPRRINAINSGLEIPGGRTVNTGRSTLIKR